MKVVMIAPTYPYKGGISLNATLLGEEIAKTHELTFVSWKKQVPGWLVKNPYDPELPTNPRASFDLAYYNPISWLTKAISIGLKKPDVLIHHWVSPFFGIIFFIMNSIVRIISPKTKVIYVCHNVSPHDPSVFVRLFRFIGFLFVSRFLIHAQTEKEKLSKIKPKAKIGYAIPPALIDKKLMKDCSFTQIAELKNKYHLERTTLLFFGYIRPYKGLDVLLRALPGLNVDLMVVGEFWDPREKYENIVKELKIESQVRFISSYVPDRDVPQYFRACDVVILPYLSATQSGPLLMAYAYDKPVIASAVGGLVDVIDEGKTGYLFSVGDSNSLRAAVENFLAQKKSMIECIRQKNKEHSFEVYARAILDLSK